MSERISIVPPEDFFNVNIRTRGHLYLVSLPAENRIGYHQFTLKGFEIDKPQELEFYHSTADIQNEINRVCSLNKISKEDLLPLLHDKITSFQRAGVSQIKGINSKDFIAFQYRDELILYYIANMSEKEVESFIASDEVHELNKDWLYKRHESDILH